MIMKRLSQQVLSVLVSVVVTQAASGAAVYSDIAEQIENTRLKLDAAGFTVAIVKDNSPVLLQGFGYADKEAQIPITTETSFRIGSVTKTFTALAVMKLVEAGNLSLDDSVYDYLPDYQPKIIGNINPEIRIRDLLTHHSGISSGWSWLRDVGSEKDPVQIFRDYPVTLSRDYLTWDRNTVHAYNNMAYTLAGLIVERVSGLSWSEFLQQNFFVPLRMENAFSHLPSDPFESGIAKGYMGGNPFPLRTIPVFPAGSIIASANDMARYMQALLDCWHYDSYAVVQKDIVKEVARQQNSDIVLDMYEMGLGFFTHTIKGTKVIEHSGNTFAFHSHLLMAPEQNLGIFISTNDAVAMKAVAQLGFSILESLLENENTSAISDVEVVDDAAADSSAEIVEGHYYDGILGLVEIVNDPVLGLSVVINNGSFQLNRLEGNVFEVVGMQGYTAEISPEHKGIHVREHGKNIALLYPVSETAPTEEYQKFLGEYTIDGGSLFWGPLKIVYDESSNLLSIIFANQNSFLKIVGDNLVQVQGRGRGTGMVLELYEANKLYGAGYDFTKVQ